MEGYSSQSVCVSDVHLCVSMYNLPDRTVLLIHVWKHLMLFSTFNNFEELQTFLLCTCVLKKHTKRDVILRYTCKAEFVCVKLYNHFV